MKKTPQQKQNLERQWHWAKFALLSFIIVIVTEAITRILFVELFPIKWWSYCGACLTTGNLISFLVAIGIVLLIAAKLNILKKIV